MKTTEYKLELTSGELFALNFVKDKYCTGYITDILMKQCSEISYMPDGSTYEDYTANMNNAESLAAENDIVRTEYTIPAYAAFSIVGLCKLEYYLYPCWSKELKNKFTMFCYLVTGYYEP